MQAEDREGLSLVWDLCRLLCFLAGSGFFFFRHLGVSLILVG